jgi:exosortase A-associated hydrolase 1
VSGVERRDAERFVVVECDGDQCLAVLAMPAAAMSRTGVVIVVGGPQTRVGSHRQFVTLARALAHAGYPTLRFDYRGMGDSDGDARTFESIGPDIVAAVAALVRETGVSSVVLWGLCDGASAILMDATHHGCVSGVVLVNPWARSGATEKRTRLRHYYLRRLVDPAVWRKVLRGEFEWRRSAADFAASAGGAMGATAEGPAFLERMHAGWKRLVAPALVILSGRDLTAREFEIWTSDDASRRDLASRTATTTRHVAEADHTFSDRALQQCMIDDTVRWLDAITGT